MCFKTNVTVMLNGISSIGWLWLSGSLWQQLVFLLCSKSLSIKGARVKVRIRAKCSILEWQCISVISNVIACCQYVTYVSGYSSRGEFDNFLSFVLILMVTFTTTEYLSVDCFYLKKKNNNNKTEMLCHFLS